MKNKFIIGLFLAACMASAFTACGNNDQESFQAQTSSATAAISSESAEKQNADNTSESTQPPVKQPREVITTKRYTHSDKSFMLEGTAIVLHMENGWEIASGGSATDNQTDCITSFPAVIQYLDTKNTVTVISDEECEDKETFLANTQESYIEAYGSEFESINISGFEQISIGEYDSFKIIANVVIAGEKYEMTHIISNDVNRQTLSWMMLDYDGSLKNVDLVGALSYPESVDLSDFGISDELEQRIRDRDFRGMYGWDNEKKEAVKIE